MGREASRFRHRNSSPSIPLRGKTCLVDVVVKVEEVVVLIRGHFLQERVREGV